MGQANSKQINSNNNNSNETVEVLYQKMGNRWFAFSMVNDDVFVGSITQDEIDASLVSKQNQAPLLEV